MGFFLPVLHSVQAKRVAEVPEGITEGDVKLIVSHRPLTKHLVENATPILYKLLNKPYMVFPARFMIT